MFSRLRKHLKALSSSASVWFYLEPSGFEVDFLIEDGGQIDLIEAKWTQYPQADDAKNIARLRTKLKNVRHSYVICRTDSSFPIGQATAVNGILSNVWLPQG